MGLNKNTVDFIKKAKEVHGDKYDYSLVNYVDFNTKVKIICPIHGVFEQKPIYHYNYGCVKCVYHNIKINGRKKAYENFIKKAKEVHGDKYDYSLVEYTNNKNKVKIICPIHGVFKQTPIYHYKNGCVKCKINNKKYEKKIDFIEKAKNIHNNKYDYSLVKYETMKTKVKIKCPIHGVFEQTPKNHLKGCNCPKCVFKETGDKKRLSVDFFIKKAKEVHDNKYEYSLVEYINNSTKVKIKCPIHGVFEQTPRDHLSGHGCEKCGISISKTENDIYDFIKSFYDGQIIKNDRNVLDGKEIDIHLPDLNIGIEYCGIYWHSNVFKTDKNYHINKTMLANKKNIKLITIFENEWILKQNIIKEKLKHIIGYNNRKIYARKTKVEKINNNVFKLFLEQYHIQGYNKCSIKYGLYYEDELVSVIGFKRNKEYWDLNRFASKYNVVGGFSKLLKYFVKNNNPFKIITFADLRYTYIYDNVYLKNGFKHINITQPNYFYFKQNKLLLESRIKYQKHKLKEKLSIYDDNLSEFENMINNDYNWIYDCGNIKYELTL